MDENSYILIATDDVKKAKYKKIAAVSGGNKCSYIDRKLTTGTKYSYIVKAYSKNGKKITWSLIH